MTRSERELERASAPKRVGVAKQSATKPSAEWPAEEVKQGWLLSRSAAWSARGRYTIRDKETFLSQGRSLLDAWKARAAREEITSGEKKKFMASLYRLAAEHNHVCGKWMVFAPLHIVDQLWADVSKANLADKLGGCCKICAYNKRSGSFLICVYTRDFTDVAECQRILYALHDVCKRRDVRVIANFKCDFLTDLGVYRTNNESVPCSYTLRELRLTKEWPERRLKRLLDNLKRKLRNEEDHKYYIKHVKGRTVTRDVSSVSDEPLREIKRDSRRDSRKDLERDSARTKSKSRRSEKSRDREREKEKAKEREERERQRQEKDRRRQDRERAHTKRKGSRERLEQRT